MGEQGALGYYVDPRHGIYLPTCAPYNTALSLSSSHYSVMPFDLGRSDGLAPGHPSTSEGVSVCKPVALNSTTTSFVARRKCCPALRRSAAQNGPCCLPMPQVLSHAVAGRGLAG